LSSVRRPSTSSAGQSDRLAMVRFFDLGAVAKALAQQDGGRRIPVRDRFDIHGDNMATQRYAINMNFTIYMATFYWPFSENFIKSNAL
jgi:hypothetical protein